MNAQISDDGLELVIGGRTAGDVQLRLRAAGVVTSDGGAIDRIVPETQRLIALVADCWNGVHQLAESEETTAEAIVLRLIDQAQHRTRIEILGNAVTVTGGPPELHLAIAEQLEAIARMAEVPHG